MQFSKRMQGYSGSAYTKGRAEIESLRKIASEVAASGKLGAEAKQKAK